MNKQASNKNVYIQSSAHDAFLE